jgi:hypothetical protein
MGLSSPADALSKKIARPWLADFLFLLPFPFHPIS